MKQYREKNKKRLSQQQKEYHEKNKAERNLQSSEYRKKHVVRLREYWKKVNAEAYAKIQAERINTKESGCVLCGYSRCDKALEYHHLDPSVKESLVSATRSIKRMKEEAGKCVLLCANCHREVHSGVTALSDAELIAITQ
jgi:ferredoxin-like protein FixX